ncbi:hypothetical protein ABK040_001291 [Willaertia magna]
MDNSPFFNLGVDLDDTLISSTNQYRDSMFAVSTKWKIKESAKKYLPLLAEHGFNFHLITAREDSCFNEVKNIVSVIEIKLNIKFSSITLTNHCPKGSFAKEKNCLYMIDDYIPYIIDCESYGVKPILFGTRKILKSSKFETLVACQSWKEVSEKLIDEMEDLSKEK